MSKYPGYDTRKLQDIVSLRDGWKCHYCGRELIRSGTFIYVGADTMEYLVEHHYMTEQEVSAYERGVQEATIDHIVPRIKGGKLKDPENTVLSCRSCNSSKGAK